MVWFSEFHLWENIRYKSWWILTSFLMSEDELRQRQSRVINILEKRSWIILREEWNEVIGDISKVRASNMWRIRRLLEENSILIDALHYFESEVTRDWEKLSDITNTVNLLKVQIMLARGEDKAQIYNFIDINIWEIIFDLTHDLKLQRWKASEEEKNELEQLIQARKSFLSFINRPKSIMIGG